MSDNDSSSREDDRILALNSERTATRAVGFPCRCHYCGPHYISFTQMGDEVNVCEEEQRQPMCVSWEESAVSPLTLRFR